MRRFSHPAWFFAFTATAICVVELLIMLFLNSDSPLVARLSPMSKNLLDPVLLVVLLLPVLYVGLFRPMSREVLKRRQGDEQLLEAKIKLEQRVQQQADELDSASQMLRTGESERKKLARAVDQSASLVLITDAEGRIEYVNRKFIEVTGYTADEAKGKTPRILKSGEQPPAMYEGLWRLIKSGKEWRGEFHNKKKSGELYWAASTISPIKGADGTISHFLAVQEDTTKQRAALSALEQSHDRFQKVTNATRNVVWDWDLATNGLWWNEAMESVFGHRVRDLKPDVSSWTNHLHPEDLDRVATGIHMVIDRGGERWEDEYRFRCADGRYADVHDCGYVVRDGAGRALRMIGAMRDITERKRVEEMLRAKLAELEQFQLLTVGRENQMIELKKSVNALSRELGRPEPYDVSFTAS